jgi:hypothetical protein
MARGISGMASRHGIAASRHGSRHRAELLHAAARRVDAGLGRAPASGLSALVRRASTAGSWSPRRARAARSLGRSTAPTSPGSRHRGMVRGNARSCSTPVRGIAAWFAVSRHGSRLALLHDVGDRDSCAPTSVHADPPLLPHVHESRARRTRIRWTPPRPRSWRVHANPVTPPRPRSWRVHANPVDAAPLLARAGRRPDHGARVCTRLRWTELARARESGGRRPDHGAGACTRIRWTPPRPRSWRVHANPVDRPDHGAGSVGSVGSGRSGRSGRVGRGGRCSGPWAGCRHAARVPRRERPPECTPTRRCRARPRLACTPMPSDRGWHGCRRYPQRSAASRSSSTSGGGALRPGDPAGSPPPLLGGWAVARRPVTRGPLLAGRAVARPALLAGPGARPTSRSSASPTPSPWTPPSSSAATCRSPPPPSPPASATGDADVEEAA